METMYFDYKNMRKGIYLTLWKMTWFFSFKVSSQHLKSLRKGHIYIVTYSLSKNNGLNMTWCIFLSLSWSLIIWHHFISWKLWVWSPMVDLHFLYKKILNCTFCQILYNLKCLMVFPWIYMEIRAAFYKKTWTN